MNWARVLEVDSFGQDQGSGLFGGIVRNDELADVSCVAMTGFNKLVGAQRQLLKVKMIVRFTLKARVAQGCGCISYSSSGVGIGDANKVLVSPLENNQAHDGVGTFGYSRVEQLDENKRINRSAPCCSAVHAYAGG